MLPITDLLPHRSRPVVTQSLIAANVAVHLFVFLLGPRADAFRATYGLVPGRLFSPEAWQTLGPLGVAFTLLSFMFIHGGLLHLGSNMLFLWIFGDNVEDRMGRGRFLMFYLVSGLISGIGFALLSPFSTVPLVGASGAIAGVLAAYALLFPGARIRTLIFFFLITFVDIPAAVFIGLWFVLQLVNGVLLSGASQVAWWAHVFGFIAGWIMTRAWFGKRRQQSRYHVWVE